jgi:hypothetical protein
MSCPVSRDHVAAGASAVGTNVVGTSAARVGVTGTSASDPDLFTVAAPALAAGVPDLAQAG